MKWKHRDLNTQVGGRRESNKHQHSCKLVGLLNPLPIVLSTPWAQLKDVGVCILKM